MIVMEPKRNIYTPIMEREKNQKGLCSEEYLSWREKIPWSKSPFKKDLYTHVQGSIISQKLRGQNSMNVH
jgi:hypothetical protein